MQCMYVLYNIIINNCMLAIPSTHYVAACASMKWFSGRGAMPFSTPAPVHAKQHPFHVLYVLRTHSATPHGSAQAAAEALPPGYVSKPRVRRRSNMRRLLKQLKTECQMYYMQMTCRGE